MTAFRILDQAPVYFDLLARLAAGGTLNFYLTGTLTPQAVYAEKGLVTNLGNVINIGTDGRTIDLWGSGSYRVIALAADGTPIFDRSNVEIPGGGGTSIPAPVVNEFLTNDGVNLLWQLIRQLPDPSGQSGKLLGNDGTNPIWQTVASLGIPSVSTGSASITVAGIKIVWGSGTLPASGSNTTNVALIFPDSGFSAIPTHVGVTSQSGSGVTPAGGMPILSAINRTASGFTCWGDTNGGFSSGSHLITATTSFTYFAIGAA